MPLLWVAVGARHWRLGRVVTEEPLPEAAAFAVDSPMHLPMVELDEAVAVAVAEQQPAALVEHQPPARDLDSRVRLRCRLQYSRQKWTHRQVLAKINQTIATTTTIPTTAPTFLHFPRFGIPNQGANGGIDTYSRH